MSPTTPVNCPRELDTAAESPDGCGLSSPLHVASSPSPLPHLLRQLSPASQLLHATSLDQSRLAAFMKAWTLILPPNHPMIDSGRRILEDLCPFVHLEHDVDLWCYPTSTCQPLELMQHVQCDLDALSEVPERTIIVDQRAPSSPPLTSASAARAALNTCSPVAFDVPHQSQDGMRAAPDAEIPHYAVHTVDRTVVAGSGAVLPPYRSTGNFPAVIHVVLGQVLLLHLPLTHANERGPPRGSSLHEQFLWARRQPSAMFRVLYPGESAFVPSMHWRGMITLGCNGSSFAAVLFLYVQRLGEVKPQEDEERARKRLRPSH
ncbi:hypothetical protein AURDEDRAFT_129276 [Auricularia subglabra TFB-10046 SS5]|uniref:JmjC domain-containing protein n=1 Tax=Auricularia subglabra (strain TFB-10046 / SS5) TaxID=717982 RepID=J0D093_AURST|nr:hypothetical protein AURDEDRAFT_129276 [Auricularia subglabra TFB-10046 SS5]